MEKLDLLQEITLSGPYIKKMTIGEFLSYMDLNWSYKYGKQCNIVYNNKYNTYSLDTNNRFDDLKDYIEIAHADPYVPSLSMSIGSSMDTSADSFF